VTVAVVALWLAVAIDWPSGLAAVAGPDAAGPAGVWLFAALVSGNCHAVVAAACWNWPVAVVSVAGLAGSLLVAGHAVAAVCWSWPDPAAVAFAAGLAGSSPVAAHAAVVVSVPVESWAAAGEAVAAYVAAAVLVGVPASVAGPVFPGASALAWLVAPAALVSLLGPGERKPARQIPIAEPLLSC